MKTAFLWVFLMVFSSQSEEFKGSISIGEAPVYKQIKVFDTEAECEEAQTYVNLMQFQREAKGKGVDTIVVNECKKFKYPTAPETGV